MKELRQMVSRLWAELDLEVILEICEKEYPNVYSEELVKEYYMEEMNKYNDYCRREEARIKELDEKYDMYKVKNHCFFNESEKMFLEIYDAYGDYVGYKEYDDKREKEYFIIGWTLVGAKEGDPCDSNLVLQVIRGIESYLNYKNRRLNIKF